MPESNKFVYTQLMKERFGSRAFMCRNSESLERLGKSPGLPTAWTQTECAALQLIIGQPHKECLFKTIQEKGREPG
jgi:hypothetical protein